MRNGGGSRIGSDKQYIIPYSPSVFGSLSDYGALSPDRLSSTTSTTIPSIASFSFQKNIQKHLVIKNKSTITHTILFQKVSCRGIQKSSIVVKSGHEKNVLSV